MFVLFAHVIDVHALSFWREALHTSPSTVKGGSLENVHQSSQTNHARRTIFLTFIESLNVVS